MNEKVMNIVTDMQIASGIINIVAMKKRSVKLYAIGMTLYFGCAIVSIVGNYKAMKEF